MEEKLLSILIQGGAVGIAVLLIIINYRKDKMNNKTLNNHLVHDTEAKEKVAESNVKLATALNTLSERVGRCPNR